jgi:serine/threonine protein kinase
MLLKYLPSLEEAEIRQIGKIQRWQRGNLVGSGSYGKVYLAMNADTAELFVVKQVPFTAIDKREEVLQLEQEIALLAQLEHANIVRYLGTELSCVTRELSIFLEYMPGGSIADLVRTICQGLRFIKLKHAVRGRKNWSVRLINSQPMNSLSR